MKIHRVTNVFSVHPVGSMNFSITFYYHPQFNPHLFYQRGGIRKPAHLCQQLLLYFQLLVQLVLPLFEGDAAAALAVFDSDSPVVYLLQEAARTQLVFNPQHSGPDGEDGDRRVIPTFTCNPDL